MVHHSRDKKSSQRSRHVRQVSLDSNVQTNSLFFEPNQLLNPSQTWKSHKAKDREQFERKKNLVRYIAPEQFCNPAKPTNEPCDIVPKTYSDWVKHQADIKAMEIENMNKIIKIKEERKSAGPDARLTIISAFFGPGGKTLQNVNLSPVLSLETVFTPGYNQTNTRPQADWPCHAELQWDGDNRENQQAKTRCGRFLPALRDSSDQQVAYTDRRRIQQLPLEWNAIDNHLYGSGPAPRIVDEANVIMDNDPVFEEAGEFYLGAALMEEVGLWQEPFVPHWLLERNSRRGLSMLTSQIHAHPAAQTHYNVHALPFQPYTSLENWPECFSVRSTATHSR